MDRRAVLGALAGSLLAAPLAAEAQQADRVWRVGFLNVVASAMIDEFRQGLGDLGYVEGRNLRIESRTPAAHSATKTIPLVLINVGDPVGLGLAASLARPGGNATSTAS